MIRKFLISIFFLFLLNGCNTVTGTAEGVVKDTKSFFHYSTCVFTDAECGDLD